MDIIEKTYLEDPTYGTRRMRTCLKKEHGINKNAYKKKMCIRGIYPAPKTTITKSTSL